MLARALLKTFPSHMCSYLLNVRHRVKSFACSCREAAQFNNALQATPVGAGLVVLRLGSGVPEFGPGVSQRLP